MASKNGGEAKDMKDRSDDIKELFENNSVASGPIGGDIDVFNGITIRPHHLQDANADTFSEHLAESLKTWKEEGRRGIWINIRSEQADLIPIATKLGFEFHHAQKGYVMMTKWLPTNEPNVLPRYPHHAIGVGGFVVNDKNQILVIQEKYLLALKRPIWKFPGGLADPGESIGTTAVREVKEETGIDTEFLSILSFRHMRDIRWHTDDLYFMCLLRPLTTDVTIDTREIAACKWIDLDEYINDPDTTPTNKMFAESYVKSRDEGLTIIPNFYPNFLKDRPELVFYSLKNFAIPFPRTSTDDKDTEKDTIQPRL